MHLQRKFHICSYTTIMYARHSPVCPFSLLFTPICCYVPAICTYTPLHAPYITSCTYSCPYAPYASLLTCMHILHVPRHLYVCHMLSLCTPMLPYDPMCPYLSLICPYVFNRHLICFLNTPMHTYAFLLGPLSMPGMFQIGLWSPPQPI